MAQEPGRVAGQGAATEKPGKGKTAKKTKAKSATEKAPKAPKATKAVGAAKTGKAGIQVIPGSAETVAERTARLQRECKGGVNAGACTGYTR